MEKNLTVAQLAKKCGITRAMIYRYEKNVNKPGLTHVKALAAALGKSVNALTK